MEFLSLDGKFHREFVHNFLGIAVDNQRNCFFGRYASLVTVEKLIFRDFRGRGLVFDYGGVVFYVDIWESVGAASRAEQQRVTLSVVSHA